MLCFLEKQIKLTEGKVCEVRVGEPAPKPRLKYRKMALKRINLKKNYLKAIDTNPDTKTNLIADYLAIMGNNIVSSSLIGNFNKNPQINNGNEENNPLSITDEPDNEDVTHFEQENPYSERIVGV